MLYIRESCFSGFWAKRGHAERALPNSALTAPTSIRRYKIRIDASKDEHD